MNLEQMPKLQFRRAKECHFRKFSIFSCGYLNDLYLLVNKTINITCMQLLG